MPQVQPKRDTDFHYLVLKVTPMEDIPLHLYNERAAAERNMWKRMQNPEDDMFCYRIVVFRDGKPDALITETMVQLNMKGCDHEV